MTTYQPPLCCVVEWISMVAHHTTGHLCGCSLPGAKTSVRMWVAKNCRLLIDLTQRRPGAPQPPDSCSHQCASIDWLEAGCSVGCRHTAHCAVDSETRSPGMAVSREQLLWKEQLPETFYFRSLMPWMHSLHGYAVRTPSGRLWRGVGGRHRHN